MGVEIERKFLVDGEGWRKEASGVPYAQGYLCREKGRTVRVRIAGERAYLTIKGPVQGISRAEFEYPLPPGDAAELMTLCDGPIITKMRHRIPHDGLVWEVDEFHGDNEGLIVAEVELTDPEQAVSLPSWVGQEVTGDPRYYNSSLSAHPYRQW